MDGGVRYTKECTDPVQQGGFLTGLIPLTRHMVSLLRQPMYAMLYVRRESQETRRT